MNKILLSICVLLSIILFSSSALADKVADANGTITVNNDNGQFDAALSNIITVTFSNPPVVSSRSGGGGGFDKTNYSSGMEEAILITNLQELLSTVQPSELGYTTLPLEKMKAELLNTITANTRLDSGSVSAWSSLLPAEAGAYISDLVSLLGAGSTAVLNSEHKMELFVIKTIYANNAASVYRTRVTITITAPKDLSNVRVIELIPKSVVSKASDLIFIGERPSIVSDDPLLEWKISFLRAGESRSFTFYIKDKVEQDDFKTITIYDQPKVEPQQPPTGSVVAGPEPWPQEFPEESAEGGKKRSSVLTFLMPLLVLIILAGLVFAGSYVYSKKGKDSRKEAVVSDGATTFVQGQKSLMIRPELVIPYEKVRSVEHFIEEKMRQGIPDAEIRRELVSSGWDDHAVDVVVHDVHVVDNNVDKLDSFIQACLDKGMTTDGVKRTLLNVGWREDVVDLVLEDFRG